MPSVPPRRASRQFRPAMVALGALAAAAAVALSVRTQSISVPSSDVATAAVATPVPMLPTVAPGRVLEATFWSDALGRDMPYSVYLPDGYDLDPEARYPVLYMLHGLGGDHVIEWRAFGVFEAADALTLSQSIRPFIVVLPEGEDGYWVDHVDGGGAWATYVARDLVGEIDGRFRTIAHPGARALGGNSMGGHGAIQIALNFPERFGVVGIHSPALRTAENAPAYFGTGADFEARDPASLLRHHSDAARRLQIWMDVGDQDPWLAAVDALRDESDALGIPLTFRELPGVHDDEYWTANVGTYLRFYSDAFGRAAPGG